MKKLFYLLLVIPFAMMVSSCSNENDLPNVKITMSFDNAAVEDGTVYVLEGETFSITGISTKAVDTNQQSAIANVRYFWNGYPAPEWTWSEMPIEINMAEMPQPESRKNLIGIEATLLETDKSMSYCSLRIPVVAVDAVEDLPDGLVLGETSITFTTARSDK